MNQEAKTFFKQLASKKDIMLHESGLGEKLCRLEEFDFWGLLQENRSHFGKPIIVFEVGASQVLHFHNVEFDHDIYIEVMPKDRNSFLNLLEDYKNYVDR